VELEHGVSVAGYRIEALIGQGSTGAVYTAHDSALDRTVAIKVLHPELAHDERFRERFLHESHLAAAIEHPHIVPIHAAGETDSGAVYTVMRHVAAGDLATLIAREGPLAPERALEICAQVGSALDAAHERGLVHRDVKPANALMARDGESDHAYLCDFGVAKHGSQSPSLTGARSMVGTVAYISPEQIEGHAVDGRADVYALGCMLFECLTGSAPFVRDNELATLLAHRDEAPPSPADRRPELPRALDAVIDRALAKDPDERYATCAELVAGGRAALAAPARAVPHTFVFADIRGYTAYTRTHGDEVSAQMLRQFEAIVGPLAPEHGGEVTQYRGDEALAVFDSPRAALRFAIDLQRRVTDAELPCGVGVGMDSGEAVAVGDDFHGTALNRAARLCSIARAGEVLATDGVLHLAGAFDGARYGLRRLERLKGFEQPVGVNEIHPADATPSRQLFRRLKRRMRGNRPRVRLAVAGAVVALAAVAVAALVLPGGQAGAAAFRPNSIALISARTGASEGTAAPGLHICVFAAAGNDLWACDADQEILLRVDARTKSTVDQLPLPFDHGSFAIGFGSAWVGDIASPTVRRVSIRYRTAGPPIHLPGVPRSSPTGNPENVGSMVTTRNAVWATYGFPKRIARIDPTTGHVTFTRGLRQSCPCNAFLAAGDGQLWAVGGDGAHIYRLDPRTGATISTGRLHGGEVTGAAVVGGYLWVSLQQDRGVWKVDQTGSAVDEVRTGNGPQAVSAGGGAVWVANADDGTVTRIDPRSDRTRTYRVGHRPLAVAEIRGTVFVGLAQSAREAAAGLTGRVVRAASSDFALNIDPVDFSGPSDLLLGQASGSGLMAVRSDAAGHTRLFPDLAAAPATVSPSGRTYTFRLRPRLRFSDGSRLTAQDVTASIERVLAPDLLNHYCRDNVLDEIAGQAAYEAGRAPRISGLRGAGDRVSITLARPDPTLPARLSNPCLSVVPANTPALPVGVEYPIPSSGPYAVASFVYGEQVVLRRNHYYAGPRPPHLDAIVMRANQSPEQAEAEVEHGTALYAADPPFNGPPAPDFAAHGPLQHRYGRPGGRLSFVDPPSSVTGLMELDTRQGIFATARMRRAVNSALDRRAMAAPGGASPRSLLIPPGVPGYGSAEPYPPGGDARRARALAAGHGATATIAVQAGGSFTAVQQPLSTGLARIGVRPRLLPLADPLAAAADPSRHVDAVLTFWAPDYPDPFDAINVLLDPAAGLPGRPAFFTDPVWLRRMRRAAATPPARRATVYARLDAALARGPAPVAVFGGPPGVGQLISRRLGCLSYFQGRLDLSAVCLH
jgi:serine/threonine-protein kinase